MNKKIYIIGHKNPDTDSVVAATAYAELKKQLGKENYVACRAGHLTPQTEYIYRKFKVTPPQYISNLIPRTEFFMNEKFISVDEDVSMWKAVGKMVSTNQKILPVVDKNGKYLSLLHYNAFALNTFKILNPKREDIVESSIHLIEKTLNATPILEYDTDTYFKCTIMVGDDDAVTFKNLLAEHRSENLVVVTGDRQDIQKLCVEAKVRAIVLTKDYVVSKEIRALAEQNKVSILLSHDNTATTAMLLQYSSKVSVMADKNIVPVKPEDSVTKIKPLLAESPSRCLPVVDNENKLIGIISENDLLREANVNVILVDHNELSQAVDGVEHHVIEEVIDHHRLGNISTKIPITFINKPVGSTSTLIASMYRENKVSIPKEIASLLLCGILSDTLILQSATATEDDSLMAEYLSNITGLDIKELGNEIIKSGSHIGNRKADEVIRQDMKEYTESKYKYTVSQIEVDSSAEILGRKKEFLDELEIIRRSSGCLFSALLITDITSLSSLMLLTAEKEFIQYLHFPTTEENVYYLKDVVSRKKQLIPLLTESVNRFE